MSRTNFHGPKDVRAIEVRLYTETNTCYLNIIGYTQEMPQSQSTAFDTPKTKKDEELTIMKQTPHKKPSTYIQR